MLRRRTPEREAGRLLTAIYREHSAGAYRFAYHLTRSREDADDLVQVAFLDLHRVLVRGDAIVSPGAWLSTAIRRSAINLGRRRREVPSSHELDDVAGHGGAVERSAEAVAELARIQLLLHTLPEAQHHAFVLRHWSGLSNRDIAEVLGTTESAVESLLVRARAALLQARSSEAACAGVCSQLSADRPLAPEHVTHLSGCRGCRTAQQRLARAAGVAAAAALVPNIHIAHALAATVPGFSAGLATGAGGVAAAAGTKAGLVGALAKTGAAVVAVTTVTAVGTHAHLHLFHTATASSRPRHHVRHVAPAPAPGPALSAPAHAATAPAPAPAVHRPAPRRGSGDHADRTSGGDRSGASADRSSGTSRDGGGSSAGQDSGTSHDGNVGAPAGDNGGSGTDGGGGSAGGDGGSSGGGSGSSDGGGSGGSDG
jgi:RNA polymerase sigma factor (sigma-70 family)